MVAQLKWCYSMLEWYYYHLTKRERDDLLLGLVIVDVILLAYWIGTLVL